MLRKLIQVLVVTFATLCVYTVACPYSIQRTEYTINTTKISGNLKLLFISDAHYGCVQDKRVVDTALRELQNEDFDAVILGGDIVQSPVTSKEDMEAIFARFGNLRSNYGVFYVYGNHDAVYTEEITYTNEDLRNALSQNNIAMLKEASTLLCDDVLLVGRDDALHNKCAPVSSFVNDTSMFTIVVNHVPTGAEECADAGVDLQLSGHTHGGQLFPLNVLLPVLWEYPIYGVHQYADTTLIVSSGMGVGLYNARNLHRCEYVVVNIIGSSVE